MIFFGISKNILYIIYRARTSSEFREKLPHTFRKVQLKYCVPEYSAAEARNNQYADPPHFQNSDFFKIPFFDSR